MKKAMSEIMSQSEIDKLITEYEQSNIAGAKAILEKENVFICMYCKKIVVFSGRSGTPYIFAAKDTNKCKGSLDHAYVSWKHLEEMIKKSTARLE